MIKFCTFNVENLFLGQEDSTISRPSKPEHKVTWLAQAIDHIAPDICLLIEVGGQKSLDLFIKNYLRDEYYGSLIPGNSERSIELAYLIKKGSSYTFDHLTHRNRPLNFKSPAQEKGPHFMSRDIAELRVYRDQEKKQLHFIVLGVHLKSKLDDTGQDWHSKKRRASELALLKDTYRILNQRYQGQVPIFLTGDFNGDATRDEHEEEFACLYGHNTNDDKLLDVGDLFSWPQQERATFVLFDKDKKPCPLQLDYFFVSQAYAHLIDRASTCVYRYHDETHTLPLPQSPFARAALPSDHYPLVVGLRL